MHVPVMMCALPPVVVVLAADFVRIAGAAVFAGAPVKKLDTQVERAATQLGAAPTVECDPASGRASATGRATKARAMTTIMAEMRRTGTRDMGKSLLISAATPSKGDRRFKNREHFLGFGPAVRNPPLSGTPSADLFSTE